MTDWAQRLAAATLPEAVLERAQVELAQPVDESVDRRELDHWLETLLAVPWTRLSPVHPITLAEARTALDEHHVGLERAKSLVLEEVAIRTMTPDAPQPMLFFAGPPYAGKSHFAQTIATLFGRPFVRLSLAGATRESDLRGRARGGTHPHPGLFIDALIKASTCDPVIYLDEADKLAAVEGDPVDALLGAIDPERNHAFLDRYLGIPIDLSRALIILASHGDAPAPTVTSRVTYVEFAGYTLHEKEAIARRFMLPARSAAYGLVDRFKISDEVLRDVIEGWTYEPGVGQLDARLNALARAAALELVTGQHSAVSFEGSDLERILGPRPMNAYTVGKADRVGVVNALVMNAAEGAMMAVEACTYLGHEEFFITGSVGPVMHESCRVAWTLVRRALPPAAFANKSLHLHFPKGAMEKEGPSAGVAIAVAIFSCATGLAVKHDVAMTGEVTLEGQVLRIGGLKKKVLGAHRAGARLVIIPAENEPDLVDIPAEVRNEISLVLVTRLEEVLALVLIKPPAEAADHQSPADTTPNEPPADTTPQPVAAPTEPTIDAVPPPEEPAGD